MNTTGRIFTLTTFGESHGEAIGGVVDGMPAGIDIDLNFIQQELNRRRPGQNQHSSDYDNMREVFRPSHADYTYTQKYGVRDHRGGGRSSARITISRCVAGALAKLALRQLGIEIVAYTSQVGPIALERDYHLYDLTQTESNAVRCPDQQKAEEMIQLIQQVKAEGDTIGGIITCVIKGSPVEHQCREGL